MRQLNRREMLQMGMAAAAVAGCAGAADAWAEPLGRHDQPAQTDWSAAVITSLLHRKPDPVQLGGWGYAIALYLYGTYLVYQRTGDKKHLDYMRGWVDSHVNDQGVIDKPINSLDYMLPGNLLVVLYKETGEAKYKLAAESIRTRLNTYPRTPDGGFWHATRLKDQLWLDGMYMSMPFLVHYGEAFNDSAYAFDEAAKQLMIYASHLNDPPSGLMFHAYDGTGTQPWAEPVNHHSSVFWCRAIGWFGMTLVDVLALMPKDHPHREDLIRQVRQLAAAYERWQDGPSGRWFQVVNRGDLAANWLETSSSCMYTYTLLRAMRLGYIPRRYTKVAARGYRGVLSQVSRGEDGFAHIANICVGTNVGDLPYYLNRPRATDDFHGLGAFLIMNEEVRSSRLLRA